MGYEDVPVARLISELVEDASDGGFILPKSAEGTIRAELAGLDDASLRGALEAMVAINLALRKAASPAAAEKVLELAAQAATRLDVPGLTVDDARVRLKKVLGEQARKAPAPGDGAGLSPLDVLLRRGK